MSAFTRKLNIALVIMTMIVSVASYSPTEGETVFHEDFESGWGSWTVSNGVWEIGVPTAGPQNTHSGVNCAATVLADNYPANMNTRLVSPQITLPVDHVRLKFWHWYNFYYLGAGDYGAIQISTDGIYWKTVTPVSYDNRSEEWTQSCVDLSNYAGQSVRIAFYGFSNNNPLTVAPGWYLDDVSIVAGEENLPDPEDFESGIGDWGSDNGLWQVGIPAVGPDNSYSGQNCAGTVLGSNYPSEANTRFITPLITLATGHVRMKFWHWHSFYYLGGEDYGNIQITTDGINWTTIITPNIDGRSEVWTQSCVDLSDYAGLNVRIAFNFRSNNNPNETGPGWYIDDVSIDEGDETFNNPEDFESGVGDWGSDNGLWQVGIPEVGPDTSHSGQNCAGTVLEGNYFSEANTRLVSPQKLLTPLPGQQPTLFFWHWYSMGGGDQGQVQISVNNGPWQDMPGFGGPYTGSSTTWSQDYVSLSAFQDSTIRIGFLFTSNNNPTTTGTGWYIDDIRIEGITGIEDYQSEDPHQYSLSQNYPNPFNNHTTIPYQLDEPSKVRVLVYNIMGQKVKELVDEHQDSGYHSLSWDGKDQSGKMVASGIYLCHFKIGRHEKTMRMLLLR